MTIYVDDAGIQATVQDRSTGRSYASKWCHLFSDQIEQDELHAFAAQIGLKREWFQPGKAFGRPQVHDPVGDHYDLTAGAVSVDRDRAVELWRAKRAQVGGSR